MNKRRSLIENYVGNLGRGLIVGWEVIIVMHLGGYNNST